MASRPIWRGHLRLALVSCPVALYNARHDRAGIRFNLINPETGNRIRMITQDAETGKELERRDLVKGYEFRKNQYLLLTRRGLRQRQGRELVGDDGREVRRHRVHRPGLLRRELFPGARWRCRARRLCRPAGGHRQDRQDCAVAGRDLAARADDRPAPDGRRPDGAHALRGPGSQQLRRNCSTSLAGIKTDPEMVQLATQLVQRQAGKYDSADLEDRYETRLRAMIDAKLKGEGIDADARRRQVATSNVVDLMAALKKSLGQEAGRETSPSRQAKVAKLKPARRLRQRPSLRASAPDPARPLLPSSGAGSAAPLLRGRRCSGPRSRAIRWPTS